MCFKRFTKNYMVWGADSVPPPGWNRVKLQYSKQKYGLSSQACQTSSQSQNNYVRKQQPFKLKALTEKNSNNSNNYLLKYRSSC